MMRHRTASILACATAITLVSPPLVAQSPAPETPAPGWARVSLLTNTSSNTPADGGASVSLTELVTNVAVQSPTYEGNGTEYGADLRLATYPGANGRANRTSVYDLSATRRLADGRLAVRLGQMWLNEVGSLGSVGGVLVEARQTRHADGSRWRVGLFGGLEPEILQPGYASGVKKAGGYVAYDGPGAQRNGVGLVTLKNQGLTERSVLMTNNFLPLGKQVFVFQSAEYDLAGPAGLGSGGLSYFFTNARITASKQVELQATYHRGRSIDARTVSNDTLNGRPIDQRSVEGLLFESVGGRVTLTPRDGLRLWAGFARDQTNQDSVTTGRFSFGASLSNLRRSGLDITVSDSRILRNSASSYDSWYVSVGHTVGNRAYVSADYTTSLSTLTLNAASVASITTNPRTQRFSGSATVTLTPSVSLLVNADHTVDQAYTDNRVLAGLIFRMKLR